MDAKEASQPPIVRGRFDTGAHPASEPTTAPTLPTESKGVSDTTTQNASTLFATYSIESGHSYTAEHFGVPNVMNDKSAGVVRDQVQAIESYLQEQVKDGALDNKVESVKERITRLEKMALIDPTASNTVKLRQLSYFVEYLGKLKSKGHSITFDGSQQAE